MPRWLLPQPPQLPAPPRLRGARSCFPPHLPPQPRLLLPPSRPLAAETPPPPAAPPGSPRRRGACIHGRAWARPSRAPSRAARQPPPYQAVRARCDPLRCARLGCARLRCPPPVKAPPNFLQHHQSRLLVAQEQRRRQRAAAVAIAQVGRGAGLQEKAEHRRVRVGRRLVQHRRARPVPGHQRPALQQLVDDARRTVPARNQQRGGSVGGGRRVDVAPRLRIRAVKPAASVELTGAQPSRRQLCTAEWEPRRTATCQRSARSSALAGAYTGADRIRTGRGTAGPPGPIRGGWRLSGTLPCAGED
eukprot:scaffold5390_cov116-Isochrysis_galbana.AAC.16